jgi:hypothetical protein
VYGCAERDGTVVQETTFRVRRVAPTDFADEFTTITYGEPLALAFGIEPVSRQMLALTADGVLSLRSLDGCRRITDGHAVRPAAQPRSTAQYSVPW